MKKRLSVILIMFVIFMFLSCSKDSTSSDTEPPTIEITYPPNNSVFVQGTIITIIAEANDNESIDEVRFYIDGELESNDSTEPYQYDWNTIDTNVALHTMYVKAIDGNQNETMSSIFNIEIVSWAPINPIPENYSFDIPINTTLFWECNSPQGSNLVYDLYFGSTPTLDENDLIADNLEDSFYILDPLLHDQTYYWKIIAIDSEENQSTGEIWNFTTIDVGAYINIPTEYSTIQEGIDAAIDGDIILVDPGVYIENINYLEKSITVASLYLTTQDDSYISQTIIDGNNTDSVVQIIDCGESNQSLIGFTITNGYACNGSIDYGGGIYCRESHPILKHLIVTDNSAYEGPGICIRESSAILEDIVSSNNSIVDNNFYNNGGGIYISNSDVIMKNIKILNNNAERGGGLDLYESTADIENIVCYGNTATVSGGGIYCWGGTYNFTNIVVTENNSGISAVSGAYLTIINSIIYAQNSRDNIFCDGREITITYSDVEGGWTGEGNIDTIPLFINPSMYNFHLQTSSLCINAGNPNPQYNDPDGTRNDMGAHGGPGGDW